MAEAGRWKPMGRHLAWAGLALALAVGAAVRWTPPAEVEDLRPRPDALEYEEAARNLLEGRGYGLVFDGGLYPPRYPPGFSLLLAPSVWLTGGRHGGGVWAVLACALAGVAAVWALGFATGGPASAVAAALLLAVAPLHVRWSRAVMSDVPTATAVTLLALGALRCLQRDARPAAWAALGTAMGLTALLRSTCLVVAAPVAVTLALRGRGRALAAAGAGIALGLVPLALYNGLRFGSPLASGYEYWVAADFFDWRHAAAQPAGGGDESNLVFYLRQLSGLGTLHPWPIALLAATGLALGAIRPGPPRLLAGLTTGTALGLLAVHLPFFWQSDRFLLPVLPLTLALAALPLGAGAPPLLRVAGGGLAALVLVSPWLGPDAFAPPDGPLGEVAALRIIAERVEPDAALIAHANVVLVDRLYRRDTDRLWLPAGRCEHRQVARDARRQPIAPAGSAAKWVWDVIGTRPDGADLDDAVRLLLASGRPVYFAPILSLQHPAVRQVEAQLAARFVLQRVPGSEPSGLSRVRPRP